MNSGHPYFLRNDVFRSLHLLKDRLFWILGRPSRRPRDQPPAERAGNSPRPGPGPGLEGPGLEGAVQLPLRGLLQGATLSPQGLGLPAPRAPRVQQMAPRRRRCH